MGPLRAVRPSGTVMLYGALGGPVTTVSTLELLYQACCPLVLLSRLRTSFLFSMGMSLA
jgi:hypothetical protein